MKEESDYSKAPEKEAELKKALGIQVRKVIGPFAAPKKIVSSEISEGAIHGTVLMQACLCSTSSETCPRPDQVRSLGELFERS
jgi:hypothetical protein